MRRVESGWALLGVCVTAGAAIAAAAGLKLSQMLAGFGLGMCGMLAVAAVYMIVTGKRERAGGRGHDRAFPKAEPFIDRETLSLILLGFGVFLGFPVLILILATLFKLIRMVAI